MKGREEGENKHYLILPLCPHHRHSPAGEPVGAARPCAETTGSGVAGVVVSFSQDHPLQALLDLRCWGPGYVMSASLRSFSQGLWRTKQSWKGQYSGKSSAWKPFKRIQLRELRVTVFEKQLRSLGKNAGEMVLSCFSSTCTLSLTWESPVVHNTRHHRRFLQLCRNRWRSSCRPDWGGIPGVSWKSQE